MNTIAYFVYGERHEYQLELSYSIASAMRFVGSTAPDWQIVLVTEEHRHRPDLPVTHLPFSSTEFASWTRGGAYQHEAKIHVLKKVLETFGGKVLLIDTDTCFLAHPDRLFEHVGPGRTLMHAREGLVASHPEWQALLHKLGGPVAGYSIDASAPMLNSGVVGIDGADRTLLDDVIALAGELHRIQPVFSIEQFAFSTVLSRRTTVAECQYQVAHYWGHARHFAHAHIGRLFPQLDRASFDRNVDNFVPMQPATKRPIDQLAARLKAFQRGQSGDYRFAYLASLSAQANAKADPPMANAWAHTCLEVLKRHPFPITDVRRDFQALAPSERTRWMSSGTRQAWQAYWDQLLGAVTPESSTEGG